MPNIKGDITWTPQDEERLLTLTLRKAEFERTAKAPIYHYFNSNLPGSILRCGLSEREERSKELVNWLIADADTIRDLLAPFDSGERPAQASKE
jgi:hypothetical protein